MRCVEKEERKVEKKPDYVNDGLDILKNIFKKPVDTIAKYSNSENFTLGLILMGIGSLLTGIVLYFVLKEIIKSSSIGLYGYALGMSSNALKDQAFKIIMMATLYMVAYFAVVASMLHVFAGSIFKVKDSDIKKTFALVGASSVILSIVVLVSGIAVFINGTLAAILFVLGSMIFNYALYHSYFEVIKVDKNKVIYAFTGTIAVAMFIVGYLLPKILN